MRDETSSQLSHVPDLLVSEKNMLLIDRFSVWNLRLLHSFFSEASKGEEVFLRVDKEFLDQVGQDIGGDIGFLEVIREGPLWADPNSSFVERVRNLIKQRQSPRRNYKDPGSFDPTYFGLQAPTYLPYLAALVRNDSENPNAYYDGLQRDLRLHHTFGSNEMKRIQSVWGDLQAWTEKNNGRFGFFKRRQLGGYALIGVPRSQSILKPHDVENLALVFVQAQIKPGQELTEDLLARILDEARAMKGTFTAGFQTALDIAAFEPPILASIRSAYSDWDGTLQSRNSSEHSTGSSTDSSVSNGMSVGISLAVVQHSSFQVSPCWRLPAIQDSGEFSLFHKELMWRGQFSGTEGANTELSTTLETKFWELAEIASTCAQQFDVHQFGCDDDKPTIFRLMLRQHLLWILIPAFDAVTGDIELREGDLPGSGPAFLLAPPNGVTSLEAYLEREKPEYELISAVGLPERWLFARLDECASLTPEQRLLPDGDDGVHPKPLSIRFVGGRSIRRGYSRMYLPYDLPFIELDAPEGTRISYSNGVKLVATQAATDEQIQFRPLKRFEIRLDHSRGASYEFRATAKDGTFLGQARLRVSGLGGEIVDTGSPFSLDQLGRPLASNEGLTGALLPALSGEPMHPARVIVGFDLQEAELGSEIDPCTLKSGAPELFLDRLAQAGSLNYGVARDLLQRLIQNMGDSGEPALILLELRRRGHLEISSTHKGHIARIHAVKPTFYSLPFTCTGRAVWALAGTLRIAQWEFIARETKAWTARRCIKSKTARFSSWRLLVIDQAEATNVSSRIGFEFAQTPCVSIANWSGSLETFRGETFRNTMESIGSTQETALRFTAGKGLFTATPCGETCELWKVRDLDTGMDNLYVLADQGKYAFVRDSRWGVWLAIDAFAKWVSTKYGVDGVHPMPIMYKASDRTVWLPARISPPSILERALVLCSGNSPEVQTFQRYEAESTEDRLLLSLSAGRPPMLAANCFYTDMAEGKWLAYRHVPELVARLVAYKLGAVLDII